MRIKKTLIPLLAFGLMGASSYAVAQSYVFRMPASGAKANNQSVVKEEVARQENIDMCLNETADSRYNIDAELVAGATPMNFETHYFELKSSTTPKFHLHIEDKGGYSFGNTSSTNPDDWNRRIIALLNEKYGIYGNITVMQYVIGDEVEPHYYEAYSISDVKKGLKSQNYDWCVDNGYETAN